MRLTQIIEALLFASDAPLSAADLARVDERLDEDTVTAVVDELRREYDEAERSFQIYEVAGGFQLLTRPEYSVVLEQWETVPTTARLSLPALEVLAIIAYRQPIGRAEVEEIRGVQSSAVLRTLQDRHLIDTVGRAEGLGRPMLYGTTRKFLEHFGFRSMEDLPRPDELPVVLRERPPAIPEGAAPDAGNAEVEAQAAAAHPRRETTGAAVEAGAAPSVEAEGEAGPASAGDETGDPAESIPSETAPAAVRAGDEPQDGDAAPRPEPEAADTTEGQAPEAEEDADAETAVREG